MLQEAGESPGEWLSASENHVQELEAKHTKQFDDRDQAVGPMVGGANTSLHDFS